MTFPTIPTAGAGSLLQSSQATATTTHTFPNLTTLAPSAGDLLLAVIVTYNGGAANAQFSAWGGSFTEFVDQSANSTTVQSIGAAYKFATGSETGTFTVTSVSSTRSVMFLMKIPGAHASTPPEGGAKADGTSAAANPVAHDPAGWAAEDTLWVAVGVNGETSLTGSFTGITAAPTNYTNYLDSGIIGGDVIGALEGAVGFRQLNTASEDAGTFTVDVGAAGNSALLLAVRPAPTPADPAIGLPSRKFVRASSERVALAPGSITGAPFNNRTWVALVRRASNVGASLCVVMAVDYATDILGSLSIGSSAGADGLRIIGQDAGTGISPSTAITVLVADGWCLIGAGKAAGTATPRFHRYKYADSTATHTDAGATWADQTQTVTELQIGAHFGVDAFDGNIAAAAVFPGVLTDAQFEALAFSLQAWRSLNPLGLWVLDQPHIGQPVLDAARRGANQTAITGTSVVADRPAALSFALPKPPPVLPAVAGDATATPAVIAVTVALPQTAVGVGAAPAQVATVAALPAAGIGVGVAPVPISAAAQLPAAAVGVGAAPAATATVVAVPAPTSVGQVGDATASPAVIPAVAALPQPGVGVGAAPAALAALAALPAAAVGIGAAPAALTAVAGLPAAAVSVGAAPAVLQTAVQLPQPGVGVGAAPATIAVLVDIGMGLGVDVGVTPTTVPAVVALPLPTSVGQGATGATVTPATIAILVALPAAAVGVGAAPAVVQLLVALPAPQAFSSMTVTPATIAALVTLPQPAVSVGVGPAVIVLLVALPLAAASGTSVLAPRWMETGSELAVFIEGAATVGSIIEVDGAVAVIIEGGGSL